MRYNKNIKYLRLLKIHRIMHLYLLYYFMIPGIYFYIRKKKLKKIF